MTGGTKIFLTVFGLLMLLLIVYYGFVGGAGPDYASGGSGVQDPLSTSTGINADQGPTAPNQDRLAQHETTVPFANEAARGPALNPAETRTRNTPFGLAPPVGGETAPLNLLGRNDAASQPITGTRDPLLPTPQPVGTSGVTGSGDDAEVPADLPRRPQTTSPGTITESVAAPRSNAAETVRYFQYTVMKYDTLSSIALEWFDDASKWDLIVEANPGINPNFIREGSTLRLPPKSAVRSGTREVGNSNSNGPLSHVIRPGETLSSISEKYFGTQNRWRDIYNANRKVIGSDPDTLHAGDRLVIPE